MYVCILVIRCHRTEKDEYIIMYFRIFIKVQSIIDYKGDLIIVT